MLVTQTSALGQGTLGTRTLVQLGLGCCHTQISCSKLLSAGFLGAYIRDGPGACRRPRAAAAVPSSLLCCAAASGCGQNAVTMSGEQRPLPGSSIHFPVEAGSLCCDCFLAHQIQSSQCTLSSSEQIIFFFNLFLERQRE